MAAISGQGCSANSCFNSSGMPLLASDTISTHRSTARRSLKIAAITCKIDTGHHLADRVDGIENIAQTNKMRSLDHSNDPYRFRLNLRPQQRMQPFPRRQIRAPPQDLRQPFTQTDQLHKAETLRVIVNKHIDVAVIP